MGKLVSIIIPIFNNAPYLGKCISSLLNQTYKDFEVIIADDGSSDNPEQVLSSFADQRIAKFLKLPHKGVSHARNAGLEQAKGELVVFIDGDDWVEPNHIESLVNGIEEADCAMIQMITDYPSHSESSTISDTVFKKNKIIRKEDFNILFDSYLLSSPCNKIYKYSQISMDTPLKFDEMISYSEDLEFNLLYFDRIESVRMVPQVTYHYVKHSDSGSTRYHKNTGYTLQRFDNSLNLIKKRTTNSHIIILRHIMWGIINLYHKDATESSLLRRKTLRDILNSDLYLNSKKYLGMLGLSKPLYYLIRFCPVSLLDSALKYKLR